MIHIHVLENLTFGEKRMGGNVNLPERLHWCIMMLADPAPSLIIAFFLL